MNSILNKKVLFILLILCIVYVASYCCIYTSVVVFELTKPYDPEYRCVDMEGTEYMHSYVHVFGCDFFLNPFREYGDTYRIYRTTEVFKLVVPNYGKIFIPIMEVYI